MAEAAKKKFMGLGGRGRKSAETSAEEKKTTGKAALSKAIAFADVPAEESDSTEADFDRILLDVMKKESEPSKLTDDDAEGAAALALRLAERVAKKRSEMEGEAEPAPEAAAPAPAPEPANQPTPAEELHARLKAQIEAAKKMAAGAAEVEDDGAEPIGLKRLSKARDEVSAPPAPIFAPKPAAKEIKKQPAAAAQVPLARKDRPPLKQIDLSEDEEVVLEPLPEASAEKPVLQPLPEDEFEDEDELRSFDEVEEKPSGAKDDFLAMLRAMDAADEETTDTPQGGDGGDGGTLTTGLKADAPLPEAPKEPKLRRLAEVVTPLAIWTSLALMVGALGYGAYQGGVDLLVASLFGAGILIFVTVLTIASVVQAYSPVLLTSFLFKRVSRNRSDALALAGNEILQSLGLAEGIIDADNDARLVTTRDGVVVYANDSYMEIAQEAGVRGATGLPPRIDRLFGQSGTESSKMFRLAKACRSGVPASEVLTQTMGRLSHRGKGDLPVRRFSVDARPMRPSADGQLYTAWRLQEQEVDRKQDQLKEAYHRFPRPVMALERSGAAAWFNLAAAELFGTKPGQPLTLGDVVLGESAPVMRHLWETEGEEYEVRIRQRGGSLSGGKDVVLTPFTRGGTGEGFVCVEIADKSAVKGDPVGMQAGADLTDAPFGVAVLEGDPSADGKITYANTLFTAYFPQGGDGAKLSSIFTSHAISELMAALKTRAQGKPLTKPIEVRVGEGAQAHTFRLFARPVRRRRGAYGPRQTVLYAVDITYQRRMEEESVQGQKLQQIGQIAGSVAHDFNNLLLVVKGSTELLMRNHPVGDPSYRDLAMIYETSQRAQDLTRNLLAFSRKQTLTPEICSITELLNDFTPALKRCVTEKVQLSVVHGRNLPEVKCDKGQVDLAIMNLAVNARDAMAGKGGGSLVIETKHVPAEKIADYGYEVLEEVDHVLIEVADTGGGVPAEHTEDIFEPFFTTKGEGQGTGLGLSTVAGAIGQMGGRIFLFNRLGEGATFRIFLPAVTAEEARLAAERRRETKRVEEAQDPTGKGRILVVEDEDGVRSIVTRALQMCGYEIHEATDGEEALEMIEEDAERFDLILTDIMMPEMDGPTLIQEAGEKLRGAKVVFMSGYAETAMRDKLNEIEGAKYLQKPFTLTSVAAVVKEALTR
ncbi:response regulator [Parvularcula maris]|uniref:histidine kinase n=1 Tax=Parvularcula maris TaxID=2965077 RepID=A0A9X2LAF4_9PROT|nr:response regulator [Parvularcula maris]MCQ8186081.1 response regulator [Parvularcula maris]